MFSGGDALGHLAAEGAELRDEARGRRPAERVVVLDDVDVAPLEDVVGNPAGAGVPLRAVAVPAEEVRRAHDHRRVEGARGAVDERLRGMRLGVLGDRDALVTGQRPDHDVGPELLDEALGLLDGEVGGVVRATDADELDRMTGDRAALHALDRIGLVDHLGAGQLHERHDRAADVGAMEGRELALAVREDSDLDRRGRRRLRGRRSRRAGRNEYRERKRIPQLPQTQEIHVGFSFVSGGTMPGRLDVEGMGELVAPERAGPGRRLTPGRGRVPTEPEQAVGREEHDGEEDQADQRVERAELDAADREVGLQRKRSLM